MVESEVVFPGEDVWDGFPAGFLGVGPGGGGGQVRPKREVGDADDTSPGVAFGVTVGAQLLQVQAVAADPGLFLEFTPGGFVQ